MTHASTAAPETGDVVHYVIPSATSRTELRAGLVTGISERDGHTVHLAVFSTQGLFFTQAVPYDDAGGEHTWRWPTRRNNLDGDTSVSGWFAHPDSGDNQPDSSETPAEQPDGKTRNNGKQKASAK